MDCIICQKYISEFPDNTLSSEQEMLMRKHISGCKQCFTEYQSQIIFDKIIISEKNTISNPFLITRILNNIETIEEQKTLIPHLSYPKKLFRPALIAFSIFIAITLGIFTGNLYKTSKVQTNIPEDLYFVNDANIESLTFYDSQ